METAGWRHLPIAVLTRLRCKDGSSGCYDEVNKFTDIADQRGTTVLVHLFGEAKEFVRLLQDRADLICRRIYESPSIVQDVAKWTSVCTLVQKLRRHPRRHTVVADAFLRDLDAVCRLRLPSIRNRR